MTTKNDNYKTIINWYVNGIISYDEFTGLSTMINTELITAKLAEIKAAI